MPLYDLLIHIVLRLFKQSLVLLDELRLKHLNKG